MYSPKERVGSTRLGAPIRAVYRRILGRPAISAIERRNAAYDRMTGAVIRRVMRRDSNSVDAGAHQGLFVRELLRAAPDGIHHAFEPIPALAERLRSEFPRAVVHEMALADFEGQSTFRYVPDNPGESSMIERPDRERGHDVMTLTVSVRRLDDVLPPDERIHFLKVDVEDAELALFRGALRTLERWQPVVVFECHSSNLADVSDVLDRAGLRVQLLGDFLHGPTRSRSEVEERAIRDGHWYFAAAPHS